MTQQLFVRLIHKTTFERVRWHCDRYDVSRYHGPIDRSIQLQQTQLAPAQICRSPSFFLPTQTSLHASLGTDSILSRLRNPGFL